MVIGEDAEPLRKWLVHCGHYERSPPPEHEHRDGQQRQKRKACRRGTIGNEEATEEDHEDADNGNQVTELVVPGFAREIQQAKGHRCQENVHQEVIKPAPVKGVTEAMARLIKMPPMAVVLEQAHLQIQVLAEILHHKACLMLSWPYPTWEILLLSQYYTHF